MLELSDTSDIRHIKKSCNLRENEHPNNGTFLFIQGHRTKLYEISSRSSR
jgi:hypothetical protein